MTPTPTFNGTIVNLQFVYGGSPTINNYAPPAESPTAARSIHPPSRSYSPSTSNVSAESETAPDHPTISTSWNHHAQAAPHIQFPSQPLEISLPSANLLSPIGSLMANLDSLQSHALVNHSSSRSLTAESPRS
ncbi:hypothetical protein AGABI1DRAFT_111999 [Agaricus bisporus var. burnettii JB137-S8]|uniref:Uncharacterized protein n=1 Tax=Agaricus bisporus var. burnettii (strain JB137-S8 / ATCC MYA-4627 / FGSC 10392) TaxID=597362 RepID=K5W4L7_AGABU|nr:uncharacterized protein AGABI1DRAFT_111999 [Agaricus bisporus var. burnettii JB137-S8]EKM81744.1 hypothetical protein AGABI1DRAFT_111999 [Agaricus bisporus var. burnettii JB137-S8]